MQRNESPFVREDAAKKLKSAFKAQTNANG